MTSRFANVLLISLLVGAGANAQTKAGGTPAAPATGAALATLPMHAGLWEIMIAEQAPGSSAKRTIISRVCYSADDVKSLERFVPPQRNFGMSCENRDVKAQGAEATWKIVCKGKEGSTAGVAVMTLGADSYTALAKVDTRLGGKAAKQDQTITGKRVGDCQ